MAQNQEALHAFKTLRDALQQALQAEREATALVIAAYRLCAEGQGTGASPAQIEAQRAAAGQVTYLQHQLDELAEKHWG